jgi:hypothetical protein
MSFVRSGEEGVETVLWYWERVVAIKRFTFGFDFCDSNCASIAIVMLRKTKLGMRLG